MKNTQRTRNGAAHSDTTPSRRIRWLRRPLAALFLLFPVCASAKCGSVDYSQGAEALARMHDYVVTVTLYVVYVLYAAAGVVCIISALQIYIKMNVGEDGVKKSILTLVGAILFMIGASIVMPAFFGYNLI